MDGNSLYFKTSDFRDFLEFWVFWSGIKIESFSNLFTSNIQNETVRLEQDHGHCGAELTQQRGHHPFVQLEEQVRVQLLQVLLHPHRLRRMFNRLSLSGFWESQHQKPDTKTVRWSDALRQSKRFVLSIFTVFQCFLLSSQNKLDTLDKNLDVKSKCTNMDFRHSITVRFPKSLVF